MKGIVPKNRIPNIKFGFIYLDVKKLSNINDNIYISLVMKPSPPSAKCLIDVGKI